LFERLLDLLLQFGKHLAPFVVVISYQNAGVFRLGKFHRKLEGGLHWKWPFLEEIVPENVFITTVRLQPQTVTTKDNQSVVCAGVVRYRVLDIQAYQTRIGDQHDVLIDTAMGAVLRAARVQSFEELCDSPPESRIAADIRRQVKDFGMGVEQFTFTDLGRIRSIRLITHTPTVLDN
jgi:regulator of protease activity HflC (stomatin/prohibitin superfamily)